MGKKKSDKLEKENRKNFITFVIVLLIAFGGLATYFVFKVLNEPTDYKNSINSILTNTTNESTKDLEKTKIELSTIIDSELFVLKDKSALTEITNQDKLYVAIKKMSEKENVNTDISASKLEAYYKESCLSEIKYTNENIKDYKVELEYYDSNHYDFDSNIYKYNSNNQGDSSVGIVAKNLEEFKHDNDKYIISYKYLFSSVEDNISKIKEMNEVEKSTCYYGNYNDARYMVESNCVYFTKYNAIKNKLDTYTYTFEKKDDKFILVDFIRK